ncbi:hypothetical protein EK904_009541 [Melospiza melodia maxima]|nr:hypothetical protein EK904_009541 [Melospiza melodia maxima]
MLSTVPVIPELSVPSAEALAMSSIWHVHTVPQIPNASGEQLNPFFYHKALCNSGNWAFESTDFITLALGQGEGPWPHCAHSAHSSPGSGGGGLSAPLSQAGAGCRHSCTLGKEGGIVAPVEIEVSTPCLLSGASRNSSGLLHTIHNQALIWTSEKFLGARSGAPTELATSMATAMVQPEAWVSACI